MKSTKLGCLYSLPIFFVFDLVGEIVVAMEASAVSASNAPEFFSISLMDLSADPPQHQKVCTRVLDESVLDAPQDRNRNFSAASVSICCVVGSAAALCSTRTTRCCRASRLGGGRIAQA